jgi:short-subunit dehydrogenase
VTVTAVCPGPVPTEFQATNDADYMVARLPGFAQVSAERVVVDALKAADRGRGSVVPGGPHVRLALGSTRFVPTPLALPVVTRMMKR